MLGDAAFSFRARVPALREKVRGGRVALPSCAPQDWGTLTYTRRNFSGENCSQAAPRALFPNGGQVTRSPRRSLGAVASEFADNDLLTIDSRPTRSIYTPLFRPGKLTVDDLVGWRARPLPPFRT